MTDAPEPFVVEEEADADGLWWVRQGGEKIIGLKDRTEAEAYARRHNGEGSRDEPQAGGDDGGQQGGAQHRGEDSARPGPPGGEPDPGPRVGRRARGSRRGAEKLSRGGAE